MADLNSPPVPEDIVDHARLTAQGGGKPSLAEIIETLDELIAQRCASARAAVTTYGMAYFTEVDFQQWGRRIYVLESVLKMFQDREKARKARADMTDPRDER